ncbi:hypothetical protein BGW42_002467 [Actinomortierella wolfii]|nr:hypothetical protein BGW42_002467 [Actinomortierella wolfii]
MPTSTVTTTTTTTVTPSSSQSATSAPVPVKSAINPTLRQLQTPHIPVNLVQARIQQNEEKKRQDEELAKIPITANLRSVKKIHAVMIDDLTPPSPSDPNSLGVDTTPSTSRPRSRTTSSAQDYMPGGKRRGDRDHIEAVAIPRSLAEKVEGILSRKMAGKGCLLDEMEKLREEEEIKAAKAATLPPIVRGQPRKRALTSSHIKNLVSSWDTKVEAANQTTLEAERSRKFLEERSHARAELPKFLGMNPLIQPPAMPAPPPSAGSESASSGGKVSTARKNAAGVSTRTRHASLSAPSSRASSPVEKTLAPPKKEEEIATVADENKDSSRNEDACTTTNTSSDAKTEETKDNKAESSCPPSTPLAAIPEVERSGDVLVHKAIVSRPRRKNVRGAM